LGYPLTLYILFHALFWVITRLFADHKKAAAISSLLCFTISLLILVFFFLSRSPKIEVHELTKVLNSDRWQMRVAALRYIEEKKIEIGLFKDYSKIGTSSHVPERYWFANVLANSRKPETLQAILELLNDSNINVVSMAYAALAQRKDPRVVKEILERIKISDNWYGQLYAYRALRALGWRQKTM
jgi:HEAT repeat protein